MNLSTGMSNTPFSRTTGGGFACDVAGRQPHAVDRELSALIQDGYAVADARRDTPSFEPSLPGTWVRLDDDAVRTAGLDPRLLHNEKSGFDASLYRDASGAVVLVYAGSDQLSDWKHNLGQGLGLQDAQYEQAIVLARKTKEALGDSVVLTGQSLGGGLAAAASMVNDIPAVTFNAAGVHDGTLRRNGVDADAVKQEAEQGLIRSYHVRNEILTHLQEESVPLKWAMPDAAGHKIELPDPDPLSFFERLVPGRMLMHRVDLHMIEAVMEAQDLAQLQVRERSPGSDPGTISDASSTSNRLLGDAVSGLAAQRESLGLADNERFFNAAAGMAERAGRNGLVRIDHVVASSRGGTAIAVQGDLQDPAQRRSMVDLDEAARTPARQSAMSLREQDAQRQEQVQEVAERQQRPALAH